MERGDVDLKEEESSQYQGGKVIEDTYRNIICFSVFTNQAVVKQQQHCN